VQRNLGANSGLDYRSAAEFVGCIAARELGLIRRRGRGSDDDEEAYHASPEWNLERALPMLEGLCAALRSSGSELNAPQGGADVMPAETAVCDFLTCSDEARFLCMLERLVEEARGIVYSGKGVT
jgi:hypothetical protein